MLLRLRLLLERLMKQTKTTTTTTTALASRLRTRAAVVSFFFFWLATMMTPPPPPPFAAVVGVVGWSPTLTLTLPLSTQRRHRRRLGVEPFDGDERWCRHSPSLQQQRTPLWCLRATRDDDTATTATDSKNHPQPQPNEPNNNEPNNNNNNNTEDPHPLRRRTRRVLGALAGLGMMETATLTASDLYSHSSNLMCSSASTTMMGSSSTAILTTTMASSSSACRSVVTGPYSHLWGGIPLAAVGLLAYAAVVALALGPLLGLTLTNNNNNNDPQNAAGREIGRTEKEEFNWESLVATVRRLLFAESPANRIALTAVTASMAAFSVWLMSLLAFVLHQWCAYCVASAVCSITLAALAIPTTTRTVAAATVPTTPTTKMSDDTDNPQNNSNNNNSNALRAPSSSLIFGGSTAVASLLAVSLAWGTAAPPPPPQNDSALWSSATSTLVASTAAVADTTTPAPGTSIRAASTTNIAALVGQEKQQVPKEQPIIELQSPPAITTQSSETALQLAKELQSLDATFYGAFWCSHCYEQKQAFGQEAMSRIPYVECSRDGVNAQVSLCKDKKVPGYPTWEIGGKLYPGEQALEELQEIVLNAKSRKAKKF